MAFVPRQLIKAAKTQQEKSKLGIPLVVSASGRLERVAKQLEKIFEDKPLARNEHSLRVAMEHDPDGFVDLSWLETCGALEQNEDRAVLADAVEKLSKMLELNYEKKRVRRCRPYFTIWNEAVDKKVIYMEDFPVRNHKKFIVAEEVSEIEKAFSAVGPVKNVLVPLDTDGNQRFHGFAFVEFETEGDAQKAIQLVNDSENSSKPDSLSHVTAMTKHEWLEFAKEYRSTLKYEFRAKRAMKRAASNTAQKEHAADPMDHVTSRRSAAPVARPQGTYTRFDDSDDD